LEPLSRANRLAVPHISLAFAVICFSGFYKPGAQTFRVGLGECGPCARGSQMFGALNERRPQKHTHSIPLSRSRASCPMTANVLGAYVGRTLNSCDESGRARPAARRLVVPYYVTCTELKPSGSDCNVVTTCPVRGMLSDLEPKNLLPTDLCGTTRRTGQANGPFLLRDALVLF